MNQPQVYNKTYPMQHMTLHDSVFAYRYYQNPHEKATVVLLTGGIGFSDLLYRHFEAFTDSFSVLTFDYQPQYATHTQLADAVAELLTKLGKRAWLIGQSLGGFVAQIIARSHPEVVSGLVLSNTGSLSLSMNLSAQDAMLKLLQGQKLMKRLLKYVPFPLYKKAAKKLLLSMRAPDFTPEENAVIEEVCDSMMERLNKPYESHMIELLLDTQTHFGMAPDDFLPFRDKVLLILSQDDKTFPEDVKQSLIDIMPEPTVVTGLEGGHLALLVRLKEYIRTVTEFICSRECQVDVGSQAAAR